MNEQHLRFAVFEPVHQEAATGFGHGCFQLAMFLRSGARGIVTCARKCVPHSGTYGVTGSPQLVQNLAPRRRGCPQCEQNRRTRGERVLSAGTGPPAAAPGAVVGAVAVRSPAAWPASNVTAVIAPVLIQKLWRNSRPLNCVTSSYFPSGNRCGWPKRPR